MSVDVQRDGAEFSAAETLSARVWDEPAVAARAQSSGQQGNAAADAAAGVFLPGGGQADSLTGSTGDDTLDGSLGEDTMSGGDGADSYWVDEAGDVVEETQVGVQDVVWSTTSNYALADNVEDYIAGATAGNLNGTGNTANNDMLGNEGANRLNALDGNDVVLGLAGNDTIDGGDGFLDILSGGEGADSLTGGWGHDYFNYESIGHAGDVITDFTTHAGPDDDILDFRPMWGTFTGTAGVGDVADAVASGHLTYVQNGANTQVFADADGGADNNVLMVTLLDTDAGDVQQYTLIL